MDSIKVFMFFRRIKKPKFDFIVEYPLKTTKSINISLDRKSFFNILVSKLNCIKIIDSTENSITISIKMSNDTISHFTYKLGGA